MRWDLVDWQRRALVRGVLLALTLLALVLPIAALESPSGVDTNLKTMKHDLESMGFKVSHQTFDRLVPQVRSGAVFVAGGQEFLQNVDYSVVPTAPGGGISYKGALVVAGNDWLHLPEAELAGRLVAIEASFMQPEWLRLLQEKGVRGVFVCVNANPYSGLPIEALPPQGSAGTRQGESIFVGYLSGKAYTQLKAMGPDSEARLEVTIDYPLVAASNLFAETPGGDRVLLVACNLEDVTGREGLLKIAEAISGVLKDRGDLGRYKLVLAFWQGYYQDQAGLKHYLDHPLYPLAASQWLQLETMGPSQDSGLLLQWEAPTSGLLADQVQGYAASKGIPVVRAFSTSAFLRRITSYEVSGVVIASDTPRGSDLALGLVLDKAFPKNYLQLLPPLTWGYFGLGVILAAFFWPYRGVRVLVGTLALTLFLTFIVNIRQDTNFVQTAMGLESNFSLYDTLDTMIKALQNPKGFELPLEVVGLASAKLIMGAVVTAYGVGYLWSLLEVGLSHRLRSGALGSLLAISIPDVLVALVLLWAYTRLAMVYPPLTQAQSLKGYWLPMLSLALLPTLYLTRIGTVAMQAELHKDYVRGGFALGYSRWQLLVREIQPAVLIKMLETMPTLLAMTFSNMIVVEYLFNYQGIGYFLLYLYKREDVQRFVPLALMLAATYVAIAAIARRGVAYLER